MSDCYGGLLRYDLDSHSHTLSPRSHSNALYGPQTRLRQLVGAVWCGVSVVRVLRTFDCLSEESDRLIWFGLRLEGAVCGVVRLFFV